MTLTMLKAGSGIESFSHFVECITMSNDDFHTTGAISRMLGPIGRSPVPYVCTL